VFGAGRGGVLLLLLLVRVVHGAETTSLPGVVMRR